MRILSTIKKAFGQSQKISLEERWQEYDIACELTDVGIQRFADDWNMLIKQG